MLAGGGHAHLGVLKAIAGNRPRDTDVVLVTPSRAATYSGMLPGWMAGDYALPEIQVDVAALAEWAGVHVVLASIAGLDAMRRNLVLADGRAIPYDLLSLDVGSEPDLAPFAALGDRALPIRPLDRFVAGWSTTVLAASRRTGFRLVVVGTGAGGVELALSAQRAFETHAIDGNVSLVGAAPNILDGLAPGAADRVLRILTERGIAIHHATAFAEEDGLRLSPDRLLPVDAAIIVTGGLPPRWLRASGLELDDAGRVAVGPTHLSVSHADVFAAGDVSGRIDQAVSPSGVHAVKAGRVLAHNLLAALGGGAFETYAPHHRSLYLLSTGTRTAVLSWGQFHAEGAWVWRWKRYLDTRFVARHRVESGWGR